jgi:SAM-dependent methyltransferase
MTDVDGTRETYERVADEYAACHADRSPILDLRETFGASLSDGARVIDVGCGPGWEAQTFAAEGYEVIALDLAAAFCVRAGRRVPGRVLRGDMRQLPVGRDAVDGLWACASFLHVPRDDADPTLTEFARVLGPGGRLCLSVQSGEGTRRGSTYEIDGRTFTLFGPDELRVRLDRAGFDPDTIDASVEDGWLQVLAAVPE